MADQKQFLDALFESGKLGSLGGGDDGKKSSIPLMPDSQSAPFTELTPEMKKMLEKILGETAGGNKDKPEPALPGTASLPPAVSGKKAGEVIIVEDPGFSVAGKGDPAKLDPGFTPFPKSNAAELDPGFTPFAKSDKPFTELSPDMVKAMQKAMEDAMKEKTNPGPQGKDEFKLPDKIAALPKTEGIGDITDFLKDALNKGKEGVHQGLDALQASMKPVEDHLNLAKLGSGAKPIGKGGTELT